MLRLVLGALLVVATRGWADPPLHKEILVFIPDSGGSQLFDPTLEPKDDDPPCVWGSLDARGDVTRFLALRMPNQLVAKPMLSTGAADMYGAFVEGVTSEHDSAPRFHPYTRDGDFFIFAYDWRQEIATVTAPLLRQTLEKYAGIHEGRTSILAPDTKFVIIAHGLGGLVARTFLSENPAWGERISSLYLVGTPNLGTVDSIKSLVGGPSAMKEKASGIAASLLNLFSGDISPEMGKLVGITQPSLYEMLPFQDPRWECVAADGTRTRVAPLDLLNVGTWQTYWPTAEQERKLYLNTWLRKREAEGRKIISRPEWEYCQDPDFGPLQRMLAAVREWRLKLGSLSYTNTLLSRPGEASRLNVVVGTGIKSPTGIITEGAHDACTTRLTFAPDNDGDGNVTGASVLDDLHPTPDNVKLLERVPHERLMIDRDFLRYIYQHLSDEALMNSRADTASFSD